MKYTRYILYGDPVRFEDVGVVAIPAAFMAIPFLLVLLMGAVLMDGGRLAKLKYLLYQRRKRRLMYARCVLRSLDRQESRDLIMMLIAA